MRKIVSWEGEEKVPGILIEKGALTWGGEVPLFANADLTANDVIGKASDFRREEDGSITAEITPTLGRYPEIVEHLEEMGFAVFVDRLRVSHGRKTRNIHEGRILYVYVHLRSTKGG